MPLRFPLRRLDPRLAQELRAQKKPIALGLACVLVTSLLTTATIPLIQQSVQAIVDASPVRVGMRADPLSTPNPQRSEAARLAQELGLPVGKVQAAMERSTSGTPLQAEARRRAVERLGWLSLLVVAIFGLKYWFTRGQSYFLSKAAAQLSANLRVKLFDKLQRLPISYFNDKRQGSIQSVLTNDVNVYQTAVSIVRDSIDGPVKAISAFVTILLLQWQLALIAMAFVPVMAVAIQRNGKRMRAAQKQVQDDLATLGATSNEAILGTKIVKAFAAEDSVRESYAALVRKTLQSQLRAARRLASLRPLVELIGACALAAVLYICGHLAFAGGLHVADIAALVFAMDIINQGFRSLGYVNNTYNQVQAASERIYGEILDVPEEHALEAGTTRLERPQGRIQFENVWFNYPDGTPALRGVSFTLEPGTSLALVGPSGAGKSTIADLVQRFYDPAEGRILFDGVDLRELDTAWLRAQIGVVPQQTFLFAGTIGENIRLGRAQATPSEVEEALRAAHAAGFVASMPNGAESALGERGIRLSGGEMQRIAIARALVRRPTLLLLDEATSNLDPESERAVQEALEEVMHQRTTLFIAHRLSTAARADRVLVLRRGEVMEEGSHRELMDLDGIYAGMYRAFSSGVLDESSVS